MSKFEIGDRVSTTKIFNKLDDGSTNYQEGEVVKYNEFGNIIGIQFDNFYGIVWCDVEMVDLLKKEE